MKLLLLILVLLVISSCVSPRIQKPFSPTIYAGDSASGSVVRRQGEESIKASDKAFDKMFCMADTDLEELFSLCMARSENQKAWYYLGKKGDNRASDTKQ